MAEKTSEAFVERIPNFLQFIKETGMDNKITMANVSEKVFDENHILYGKSIVMSGFRDAELKNALKQIGAKVSESVSKNTFALIVKDTSETSGKINEAIKLGVPVMSADKFKKDYL